MPLLENSDDFVFDNEMLTQCVYFGFRIGEVSCPTKYFAEASSISFGRSVKYGLGVLATSLKYRFEKLGISHSRLFSSKGRKIDQSYYRNNETLTEGCGCQRQLVSDPGFPPAKVLNSAAGKYVFCLFRHPVVVGLCSSPGVAAGKA